MNKTAIILAAMAIVICTSPVLATTPYAVTDITFRAHDDVEIFGRLVLPKSNLPRAIVIYVQTAEGATIDMKRPLGGGKTFNYYDLYREKLTAMDIGFFSYEGRGIRMGDKPPRYEKIDWDIYNTSTLDNKVQDLLIAIETVKKQEGLQQIPILLMGASEGTLLVTEAAARQPKHVAGLVLYGVMATNLRETFRYIMSDGEFLKYRSMDKNKDNIITKTEWDEVVKDVDFSKADLNSDGKFTVADIKILTKQYLDAIDNDDYKVLHAWAKAGAAVAIPDGWFNDHFSHEDMWSFLSKLDIPVGCFHGDVDRMAPISAVKELETKAKKANLTKTEFHYFEGLDHTLNIGQYFVNGKMPKGHREIFEFIDRIVAEGQTKAPQTRAITNSIGMKMVWIEPGQFLMGSGQDEKGREDDESPMHRVVLTRGFYLGETEVTQQQWEKLMGPGPWTGKGNIAQGEKMPAVMMTWAEAVSFCEKLSKKEGRRYRLPSEAEWEYACRAKTHTWFYWGDDFDERYAWSSKNSERSMHEVGTRLPNAWGLFDMGGNAWEWCSDWHGNYPIDEVTDPNGTVAGEKRVIRSGSYSNSMWDCRSAERGCVPPKTRAGSIGLRVVMQGEPPR